MSDIELKALLAKNPKVDPDLLRRYLDEAKARKMTKATPRYNFNILPPFGSRRAAKAAKPNG